MPSFPEEFTHSRDLNRSWVVSWALFPRASVINHAPKSVTMHLDIEISHGKTLEQILHPSFQLQHQINIQAESPIATITASCRETSIHFLEFLMIIIGNVCIIDISALLKRVVGDNIHAIKSSPLSVQKN